MMSGNACADAWVTLKAEKGSLCKDIKAKSRIDGSFLFEGVLPGTYTVQVRHSDAYPHESKILLEERSLSDVNITVERGCRITGVIVDAQGAPVVGAQVDARLASSKDRYSGRRGKSQKDGSFTISAAQRGTLLLSIAHQSYEPKRVELSLTADYRFEEPLILADGFQVGGRVVDEAGAAVASLSVRLNSGKYRDNDYFSRQVNTDKSGAFLLRGIPRGEYVMEIKSNDYCHLSQNIAVESNQNIVEPLVVRRGVGIAGVVLTSEGKPMTEGRVIVKGPTEQGADENRIYRSCSLGSDGSFSIYGLAEGTYEVQVNNGSTCLLSQKIRGGQCRS
jgi:protocatechuate 3,4-dioxygenase beta subunit